MGVYFDDLDALQILHNSRYLLLFERTIGSFWKHLGWNAMPNAASNPDQFHLVRANSIEYLSPVRGVVDIRVRVWIEKLGKTSLTFGMVVLPIDMDEPHARGTRTLVRVDPKSFIPTPWSDSTRRILLPYTKPGS
jgi:acyl-CoA thioester hydrolase